MREVRRGADRFVTRSDAATTHHSFSYGAHYDPDNVRFGSLVAINAESVPAGSGYESHQHADVEIVTWVTRGVLRHRDSTGAGGDIAPGVAQRLSAGHGVEHTERNASDAEPLEFVQMMLVSDNAGEPEYAQAEVAPVPGELTPTVTVHAPAELFVVAFAGGETVEIPLSAGRLVHVTAGEVESDGTVLGRGDELRTDDDAPLLLTAAAPAQALVWLV